MKKHSLPILLFFSLLLMAQTKKIIHFTAVSFSDAKYEDFSPTPYKDGILFVSNRDSKSDYYKLYYSDFKTSPIPIEIKNEKHHIGQTFYDAINDEVYVTKSGEKNESNLINLAIYKGKIVNNKIENLEKLSFCKTQYSYGYPQIRNNKLLVHTNEFGGYSLVIYTLENGFWVKPKVVFKDKSQIMNPIYKDDNTILFASKREGGLGGYDLYKVLINGEKWFEPTNLKEYNSPKDDLSIIYTAPKQGFISSARQSNLSQIYQFVEE